MKATYFLQVEGIRNGSDNKPVPAMEDWVAVLDKPIKLSELAREVKRFCKKKGIVEGELIHFQRLGSVKE